ncbi:hypothetical protein [Nocardioides cavernaquae]|uniref:FHA domain-containing protein n=1 Tax=Nocardioides cavernaquae TaxID=2321396 RepID=A0A3A5H350_9ACTN|nr:hypothetical protein [Nocardioides cavernaquae]RJS45206.1 hypothetical protein D4739_02495 [Nocardioides cavernaquae]
MVVDGCFLYRSDADQDGALDLTSGRRVAIGRSGSSTLVLDRDDVSRTAVVIEVGGQQVTFHCHQSFGSLTVSRDDGSPAATLRAGETLAVAHGTWELTLRAGRRIALVATVDLARPHVSATRSPGALTIGSWRIRDVLRPTEKTEWQLIAVLAALADSAARSGTLRPRQSLQLMVDAWFDHQFAPGGALTNRLDAALLELGVRGRPGVDKVPLLAEAFRNSGVLSDAEIGQVRAELARRADRNLPAAGRRLLLLG